METGAYFMSNDQIMPFNFREQKYLNDIGFTRGVSVFDAMEARKDVIFHFGDHIERFRNSAIHICSEKYFDAVVEPVLLDRTAELLRQNNFYESIVKIYLTAGETESLLLPENPNLYILVNERSKNLAIKKTIKLAVINYKREFPNIKHTNYFAPITAMSDFKRQGEEIDNVLYLDSRTFCSPRVLECATMNIFMIGGDGCLLTPPPEMILPGVTRMIILGLAKKNRNFFDIKSIKEKYFSLLDLLKAKEVFITSTSHGVKPVVLINYRRFDKEFGIGERTLLLQKSFNEYREQYFKSRGGA